MDFLNLYIPLLPLPLHLPSPHSHVPSFPVLLLHPYAMMMVRAKRCGPPLDQQPNERLLKRPWGCRRLPQWRWRSNSIETFSVTKKETQSLLLFLNRASGECVKISFLLSAVSHTHTHTHFQTVTTLWHTWYCKVYRPTALYLSSRITQEAIGDRLDIFIINYKTGHLIAWLHT